MRNLRGMKRHKQQPVLRRPVYLVFVLVAVIYLFLKTILLSYETGQSHEAARFELFQPNSTHPIKSLMAEANRQWQLYEEKHHSKTLAEAVTLYRERHGRHPPPGYQKWWEYARKHNAHNVDDFHQIINDLRPFWAMTPKKIRQLAASLPDSEGMAVLRIRNHKVEPQSTHWRAETLAASVTRLAEFLPDMNIAVNTMDQPRVLATYEQIQEFLKVEEETRALPANAEDRFTPHMDHFDANIIEGENPGWLNVAAQPYMKFAKDACPPDSPARNPELQGVDRRYKSTLGGFISNFSASSDICIVGPSLQDYHGFLFSSSENVITRNLLPVFSECKTSINNDILFPANMYTYKDERYTYSPKFDYKWAAKSTKLLWRGVTSGGTQFASSWNRLHRQRFVQLTNATELAGKNVSLLTKDEEGRYKPVSDFAPSKFAASHFDVGFTQAWGCISECSFYEGVWTYQQPTAFSEQFKAKYLIDIDGHSFSGRWRAFLQSRSLGIKATIFREWHDSRLLAWRHFVPMDNMFGDLYALMTYFIGISPAAFFPSFGGAGVHVPAHDAEAQAIATQGRDWAQVALRDEDMEIYLYLLLLEYARVIDDNRDHIGYSGDGTPLDLNK